MAASATSEELRRRVTNAHGVAGIAVTLSAISVALAAIVQGYGSGGSQNELLVVALVFAGFPSAYAGILAIWDAWEGEAELTGEWKAIYFYLTVGFVLTVMGYVWLLA